MIACVKSVYFPACRICGKLFCARNKASAVCSLACKMEEARRKSRSWSARRSTRALDRKCVECGKQFRTLYGDKRRHLCSRQCTLKATRRMAKAKLKGAGQWKTIHWAVVFDRDKGICQLCGKHVGTYPVPHPLAATIDHIVPLSRGGVHAYGNVQIAHFSCNVRKQNAPVEHWENGRAYQEAECLLVAV